LAEGNAPAIGVVTTIAAKCRRCYNCVRSCPAKAIRVQGGQAQVMPERCIGCGNCIRVCAQGAKQVQSALQTVLGMLAKGSPTVAILAPSYPAAYAGVSAGQVVGAVRAVGFSRVMEVGFGAEMVARAYADLLRRPPGHAVIATPCPALVSYVQKHMPELSPNLAPLVSPMIALGRAIKQQYLPGAQVVFVGPCIAKKAELAEPTVTGAVDAALTFLELEELLTLRGVDLAQAMPSVADEPLPHFGALFPVSGGLLRAAAVQADLMDDGIAVVEGPDRCLAALRELREGQFPARFVDALLCEGCVAGPAYGGNTSPLARKALVTAHVRQLQARARAVPRALKSVSRIDLTRRFEMPAVPSHVPTEVEIRDILASTNKHGPADELNCGACGYATCRDKAIAVCEGLAETEMCLPYLIDQLQVNLERLSRSKEEIERAREAAIRAEQLASMGRLASDIAHELSNPLGKIAAFAQLLRDNMATEDSRREDLTTIVAEALHSREVLASLEGFARQREPHFQRVNLHQLVERAVEEAGPALALHEAELSIQVDPELPEITADPDLMAQVLVHLVTNSLEALDGVGKVEILARASADQQSLELVVRDDGPGIDPHLLPRLCEPFVTTKSDRPGAGLGLAVAHGVVQAHGGTLEIASKVGVGTSVTLRLPSDALPAAPVEAVKVLVVDDDPDFLEQHRIMLTGMGFEVVTAERSDEAIEVSNREIPDAFVLDLMMERTDSGARLARALRRDPRFRRAPIVMLTSVVRDVGFDFYRNPREVLEWMKADAWFDKPAPVAELAATIQRLLTGERPEESARQAPADSGAASGDKAG
jgi:two-component system NtrC family sensor kinase